MDYNMGEPKKAPNIFKQFAYAFVPPKYKELAKVKTGSMIGFVTLFVLVFTLISLASFLIGYNSMGGANGLVKDMPDFEISGGRLSIEKTYEYKMDTTYFLLTDEVESFSNADVKQYRDDGDYEMVVLISATNLCMYNNGQLQNFDFKNLNSSIGKLNKDWITNTLIPAIMIIIGVGYLLAFVFGTLWYFGCAALYLLLGMMIASLTGKDLSAGTLFRAAVYSKVFMYVITALIGLIPGLHFSIPFWVRMPLTAVFMGVAIQFMEDSYDNNQPLVNEAYPYR